MLINLLRLELTLAVIIRGGCGSHKPRWDDEGECVVRSEPGDSSRGQERSLRRSREVWGYERRRRGGQYSRGTGAHSGERSREVL